MSGSFRTTFHLTLGLLLGGFSISSPLAHGAAEDLLNDPLNYSGATLDFRPYVTMPNGFNNIISMTTRPGDTRLYVTTQEGTIFTIDDDGNGNTSAQPWFDAYSALYSATGRLMNGSDGQRGLQSVAFHPDFENPASPGYGKFYTTMLENSPGGRPNPAYFYLGNSIDGLGGANGVLAEWTYDHNTGQVDDSSYRELFRVSMPNYDHPIKQARFNPYAQPGDEDYGLLYMTHGDSNNQDSLNDDPQDLGNVLGKMIRINPLQSGGDRYTIPASNPFAGSSDPDVLQEIYAYGFRNPHTFSFNPDDLGNVHILVGDIGRSNIEEVNLVVPGGNYGWTKREGTFVHLQGSNYSLPDPDAGYFWGVEDLPPNEASVGVDSYGNRYIYPVAQWDHNDDDVSIGQDFTATAIASGFVIRNSVDPALRNQFIHLNFSFNHGDVYHNDFDDLLNAVTQLDPNDPTRDEPSELSQAENSRMLLTLDHDSNPDTPPLFYDDINDLIGGGGFARNDARFGQGASGEMYISSKWNGTIYLITNTVPVPEPASLVLLALSAIALTLRRSDCE